MVIKDIKRGIVKPLDAHVFKPTEAEDAFRFMASGKHIGKVLLKLRENEDSIETLLIKVRPNIFCYHNESMIIVGGLGGFGLELADLLVLRGCKNLILSSSRGVTTSYQAYRIEYDLNLKILSSINILKYSRTWTSYNVKVVVNTSNITTEEGCQELLNEVINLGPIGGIFNLAVNLQDAPFEEQTVETFEKSLAPKAHATNHLDKLSRSQCQSLRYFVVFSSVACGKGNGGQSNYGMANSIMEKIIEERHKDGLPAKAIQWGAIGEVGLLASAFEKNKNIKVGGTLPQSISSCLDVIDVLINTKDPIVSSMIIAESTTGGRDGKKQSVLDSVLNILGITDKKTISLDTRLSKLGVDSLMVVEIQQVLERDYDIVYSSQELRALTLKQLDSGVRVKVVEENIESSEDNATKVLKSLIGDESTKDQIILEIPSEFKDIKALIIPGIEGMSNEFLNSIATQLKCQSFILQLATTRKLLDISEVFNAIIKDVTAIFAKEDKFLIIGYSFGSILALMIANHLEKLGKNGKIVMIDGSPLFTKKLTELMLSKCTNDDEIKEIVAKKIMKNLNPNITEAIFEEILGGENFEEQFKKFLEFNTEEIKYSVEYIQESIEALLNRSKIALDIDEKSFMMLSRTPITLLRSTESPVTNITDDYDLSICSKEKVEIKLLEANHASILINPETVKYLNLHVEELKRI